MTTATTTTVLAQPLFAAADAAYDALKQRLLGPAALASTEADIERLISVDGREVLRCLLQGHVEHRSATEPRVRVVGDDGIERRHARDGASRAVKSVFGDVAVARKAYTARGCDARMPLDADLNLPPQTFSLELRRMIALTTSRNSYDETVTALGYSTGLRLGRRQVEEAARAASVDFDAFYAETELTVPPKDTGDVLVITTDGKGVVMLPDSLRPATRRAARKAKRKLKTRLSKGEKKGRKRMATVAAVYTVEPFARRAEDVMAGLAPVRDASRRPRRPRPEHKRVWASLEHEPAEVIEESGRASTGQMTPNASPKSTVVYF